MFNMKESKYPIKVIAVRLLKEGRSMNSICKEFNVSPNSLRVWYQLYIQGGELNLLSIRRRSFDEKCVIVEDIVKNNLSLKSASAKYGLRPDTLKSWVEAYKLKGSEGLQRKNAHGMPKKKRMYTEEELDELEKLRRRNEWLEAENALLKKVRALVEEKETRLRATGQKPSKN